MIGFRGFLVVIGLIGLSAVCGASVVGRLQDSDAAGVDTLRVSTRLVVVDVVVRTADGPVDGLTVEDFSVYDDGAPRQITSFDVVRTGGANSSEAAPEPLPADAVSNRPRSAGPAGGGASILLLDRLNTQTIDQPYSNDQARKFLESLDGQHQVAIYELNRGLRLVQDYTSDPETLVRALMSVDLRVSGELDASYGDGVTGGFESNRNQVGLDPDLVQAQTSGVGISERGTLEIDQMVAQYFLNDRVRVTADVLDAIAQHMARLPGRKNLIWLAGRFPFSFEPRSHFTAAETSAATLRQLERTARAITDANIAVYPISAVGLLAPEFNQPVLGPGGDPASFRFRRSMSGDQSRFDTEPDSTNIMNHIAGVTGGEAFYLTNGIAEAMQSAIDDAEVTYRLGFSPDDRMDSEFHELRVVVARDAADVRYRAGYYGFDSGSDQGTDPVMLANLVTSSINATGLELVATNQPLFGGQGRYVTRLSVNMDDVDLEYRDSLWTGALEIATLLIDATVTDPEMVVGELEIEFSDSDFMAFRESGYEVFRMVNGLGNAGFLRIVVRDVSSGAAGSLWLLLD